MIVYIYEVWHFKEQSNELFHPYIKTFMKIKQEASGWPAECNTEEKKRNYLQEYEEHEGILLDYDKVKKNPSLRLLAKLMLNSFWGKFRRRPNQTQVTTCTKLSEFFQIIKDDRQVIRLPVTSPPSRLATSELATKERSRHQAKSSRHQPPIKR